MASNSLKLIAEKYSLLARFTKTLSFFRSPESISVMESVQKFIGDFFPSGNLVPISRR